MQRAPDGIHILRSHFIERVLEAVNLPVNQDDKGPNLKHTPLVKPLLIRDTSRAPRSLPWKFRSVIGMLNYLSGLTRPGMYFVVHQVARFCAEPKQSYEKPVTRIVMNFQTSIRFETFCKNDKNRGL